MTALWLLWLLMVLTSHSGRIEQGKSILILQVFSFASFYCNQFTNYQFLKEVTMDSMFVIVTMRQKDVLKKKPDTTPAIVTRIFP